MWIRFSGLLFIFLGLSSCSMPRVGYYISLSFKGKLDRKCVAGVFKARNPTASSTGNAEGRFFIHSKSKINLIDKMGLPGDLDLRNEITYYPSISETFQVSSYFVSSNVPRKLLKALRKNTNAVNYLSYKVYKDVNSLTDEVVKTCEVDVLKRETSCHSYGALKKYFKCQK